VAVEGLLLLISLTKANTDIQKIVAFENAFERLLSLIHEEGLSDGGIIVSDCLQLILNLLRGNVSNQVLPVLDLIGLLTFFFFLSSPRTTFVKPVALGSCHSYL